MKRKYNKAIIVCFQIGLVLLLWGTDAWSQTTPAASEPTAFQLQRFRPWGDPHGMWQTQSAQALGTWGYTLGFLMNYANQPLRIATFPSGEPRALVEHQLAADLLVGVGFTPWMDVYINIPITLYQTGSFPKDDTPSGLSGASLTGSFLSDIKIGIKLQILQEKKHLVSMAIKSFIGLPTATPLENGRRSFNGEDTVNLGLMMMLGRHYYMGPLKAHTAFNLGYRMNPPTALGQLVVSHELFYSLGTSIEVLDKTLDAVIDIFGSITFEGTLSAFSAPLEMMLGVKYYPISSQSLALHLGMGIPLTPGFGTGTIRVMFGLTWSPRAEEFKDTDKDGVPDKKDACPYVKGAWLNRGCPWPDTDGDGIKDNLDSCPKKAGPKENNGCPWPDQDGDGVSDQLDQCPDKYGSKDNNGCPWGDKDKDGVNDKDDKCPTVPGPKENNGCPWPDSDKDGLHDKIDKCPTVPGPKENKGCPLPVADTDTDKDGVPDKVDKCPKVAGPKDNNGCPLPVADKDKDKDGVPDKVDKCPKVAGPKENNGCPWPDSDKDGLHDKIDKCPKVAGPKENNGCPWPDSDKDGVPDKDDKCPKKAGPIANKGCPYAVIQNKKIVITQKIYFNSGSNKIKRISYPVLDAVANILRKMPKIQIRIEGHTDDMGPARSNQRLSERRAAAVKKYLRNQGVFHTRLHTKGLGESKPLIPQKTRSARAKNRRVEFIIISK